MNATDSEMVEYLQQLELIATQSLARAHSLMSSVQSDEDVLSAADALLKMALAARVVRFAYSEGEHILRLVQSVQSYGDLVAKLALDEVMRFGGDE